LLLPVGAGCQSNGTSRPPGDIVDAGTAPAEEWRRVALPQHAGITEELPPLFSTSATAASAARQRGRAAADRDLLNPDLRLPFAAPAPGSYRCRLVRLGAPAPRGRAAAPREAFCFVGAEGDRLSLTLETAPRRLGGYLWDSQDPERLVFLGAEIAPRAKTAPVYGEETPSSTAGILERIGDFRYRLVVRGNTPGSLDAWEMTAAPAPR